MEFNKEEYIWAQRYRPLTIDECILPDRIKSHVKQIVSNKEIPHFMFYAGAGSGKTTLARAIANELDCDLLYINASLEGNIDTLRTKIQQFASTVSMHGGIKIVLLDEADYLTSSVQPALRGFLETFSKNCRFILTCNFKNRIIEPLHSRCTLVDFKIDAKEKSAIAGTFFKRICEILKNENVEFDKKVVAEVITKFFPDFRKTLNELQRYATGGVIDSGLLVNSSDENYRELLVALKEKKFNDMRKWVSVNSDISAEQLFDKIYTMSSEYLVASSIPQVILILADYQYKAAFVVNQELNTIAALTEIMGGAEFK